MNAEKKSVFDDHFSCESESSASTLHKDDTSRVIVSALASTQDPSVKIKIPLTSNLTPKKVNFLFGSKCIENEIISKSSCPPSSSKGKSSIMSNLIPKLNFKWGNSAPDMDKIASLVLRPSISTTAQEKSSLSTSLSRSLSITNIFSPRMKRTSSLPVPPIVHLTSDIEIGSNLCSPRNVDTNGAWQNISRSMSVPVSKNRNIRRTDSFFRVIPSTPLLNEGNLGVSDKSPMVDFVNGDAVGGEDIPEEDAVCRICLVELNEGGDTLKMECSCKGGLALAHQECAIKWFSIKGNKTCDVCNQEVKNLSVTLLRMQSVHARNGSHWAEVNGYRVWQEVPVLIIISMLAYFCFLEQLLVGKMGNGAIAISLPFSCILGILSSTTSSTMVTKRFVWVYASVQFALVVLFAHIFYALARVRPVLSVLLATFAGFGVALCGSSFLVEFALWRSTRNVYTT